MLSKVVHQCIIVVSMHKETLIAVLIGLSLGLVLTFGIYQWQKTSRNTSQIIEPQLGIPTPSVTTGAETTANQELVILEPQEGTVTDQAQIKLNGTGPAGAFLAVLIGNKEVMISNISSDQTFSTDLVLAKGINFITVLATENSGKNYKSEILLVYEPKTD